MKWRLIDARFHQIFKAVYVRALNIASENQILDYSFFRYFWGDYLILKLMHNKFP